jgi:hypothetical protein
METTTALHRMYQWKGSTRLPTSGRSQNTIVVKGVISVKMMLSRTALASRLNPAVSGWKN